MDPTTESPGVQPDGPTASTYDPSSADGRATAAAKVAASLNLSDLDGRNGFVIEGAARGDQSGISAAPGGDVNGDGFADIMVGARFADPNGETDAGSAYLVFGAKRGFGAAVKLSGLNGSNGFVMEGDVKLDWAGEKVSSAGDVNNDGFDDLIIGARYAKGGGQTYAGRSYVVFGGDGGFPSSIALADLNGSNGFVLEGAGAEDRSGRSVAAAGDVNNDGIDDLIVGADFADPGGVNNAGAAYVVFGRDGGFPASISLGSLDGDDGFVASSLTPRHLAGRAVAGAGDVNGDGIDDILIGAPKANPGGKAAAGEAFLVFGRDGGFPANLDLGDLDGRNGVRFAGALAGGEAGSAVAGAGDVNGDGLADIIIGAPYARVGGDNEAGAAYVVFGSRQPLGAEVNLGELDGSNGFVLQGIDKQDYAGFAVSSAGDLNGDGFDDLLVGAFGAAPGGASEAGESYVVFGRGDGAFPAAIDLAKLDGRNGLVLNGSDANDRAGEAVAGLGDINRDGFDDIVIGARAGDPSGKWNAGESYVIFGGPDFMAGKTMAGTIGKNTLTGGAGADVMLGLGGKDQLIGRGGADTLYGGDGHDVLRGGGGNDRLYGGLGNDGLYGNAGADRLYGNAGADRLYGGNGADYLDGGAGSDELYGGAGPDKLYGGDGNDLLVGGPGADRLFGEAGKDRLEGGGQNDILRGGPGADVLLGGGGDDKLFGGPGPDTLIGEAGDDLLSGGGGPDVFVFSPGGGADTVTDFLSLTDLLDVSDFGFASAAEVLAATSNQGGSAVIDLGPDSSVTLQGILKEDLDPTDFIL